ncbi:hypothetical protein [Alloactinosynnema sp. L-07]|nr:hypothetical protein [Alloactinosynnema sp. L-07]
MAAGLGSRLGPDFAAGALRRRRAVTTTAAATNTEPIHLIIACLIQLFPVPLTSRISSSPS